MTRLGRNIVYNLAGQGVLLLIGLVAVRNILSGLGSDALGLVLFALTVNSLLATLFDFGVSATTIREVAAAGSPADPALVLFIRTASTLYWSAYVVLAAALILGAPLLIRAWVHLGSLSEAEATSALRVLGAGAVLGIPRSLYASLLRGLQRMGWTNLVEAGLVALQQGGAIVIITAGGNVTAVSWWFTASFAAAVAVYLAVVRRYFPSTALVPGWALDPIRRSARFALNLGGIAFLSAVQSQSDRVIVSKLLPLGSFGLYAFVSATLGRVAILAASVAQAGYPALASLYAEGERAAFERQFRKLDDLVVFGAAVPTAAVAFAAAPVLGYVYGVGAAQALLVPTALLALGYYMNATVVVPYFGSLAAGRPEITTRLNLIALVVVTPLEVLAVLRLGMVGAPLGFLVYHLLAYAYSMPRIAGAIGFPARRMFAILARAFALVGLTYVPAWLACRGIDPASSRTWAAGFLIASLLFLPAAWTLIGADLRRTIQQLSLTATRRGVSVVRA